MENPYTWLQKYFDRKFPTGNSGGGNVNAPAMPLTQEQAKILLEATHQRLALHAMLNLALYLGISMEECLKIERRDIDFQNGILHLKAPVRDLRLTDAPLRALADFIRNQNTNNGYNGQQNGQKSQFIFNFGNRTIEKAVNDLGLGTLGFPISWSSLRRTWCVMCYQKNVRIESMVRYSGSSSEAILNQIARSVAYGRSGQGELPVEFFNGKEE